MTLDDIRLVVSRKIGLDNTPAGDQPLLDKWANEAVVDILVRSHCKVREGQINLTAGTSAYPLDSAILAITDVWSQTSTNNYSMERVPTDYMNRLRRSGAGTAPSRYYTVEGSDLLKIWPTPGTGEALRIDYVPRPATLVNASDTPSEIPSEFHKAVELYTLSQAADFDDDTSSQDGDRYKRDYTLILRDIQHSLEGKQGNWGRVIINRRRARRRPHDRSTYPQYG